MTYAIIIIVIIVIIAAIISGIKEHPWILFFIIPGVTGLIVEGRDGLLAGLLIGGASLGTIKILAALAKAIKESSKNNNVKRLQKALEKNYKMVGYMDAARWHAALPQWEGLDYGKTDFDSVTAAFSKSVETVHIESNSAWIRPYLMELSKYPASAKQLLQVVPTPKALKYTHATPNLQLIDDHLKRLTVGEQDALPIVSIHTKSVGANIYELTAYAHNRMGYSGEKRDDGSIDSGQMESTTFNADELGIK